MNSKSVNIKPWLAILLALLVVSPWILKPFHFVVIHHHYHVSDSHLLYEITPIHCVIHDFLLFSFVEEKIAGADEPLLMHEISIQDGSSSKKYTIEFLLGESRGPPLNYHDIHS